jgi:hypothetical protein
MRTRRRIVAVAAVTLLALLGACSGEDEEPADGGDRTTTTASSDGTDSSTTTLAPVSDEEFASEVDKLLVDLDAAGTDLCDVFAVFSSNGTLNAQATTPAQVRKSVEFLTELFAAIGAVEPVVAESQATLAQISERIEGAAEDADYDPSFFESEELGGLVNGQELLTALQPYAVRYQSECAATGAVPGAGDAAGQ